MNKRIRKYIFTCVQSGEVHTYVRITYDRKADRLFTHYAKYNECVHMTVCSR